LPEITFEMLRAKYHALRRGVDNVSYLERICKFTITKSGKKKKPQPETKEQNKEFQSSILRKNSTLFGNMK